MNGIDRKTELLKAAYDLLKKAEQDRTGQSAMEITVNYDGTECDGKCLLEDIGLELGIDDSYIEEAKEFTIEAWNRITPNSDIEGKDNG